MSKLLFSEVLFLHSTSVLILFYEKMCGNFLHFSCLVSSKEVNLECSS